MKLTEFIEKLKELSDKHPGAIVPNHTRYSISVTDTIEAKGQAMLFYNWREAARADELAQRNNSLQNTLR